MELAFAQVQVTSEPPAETEPALVPGLGLGVLLSHFLQNRRQNVPAVPAQNPERRLRAG